MAQNGSVADVRRYTDDQLVAAVRSSRSWRGVLRALGLAATSSTAMRSVRRHADLLQLDYGHFTGQRRWSDHQLAAAVAASTSWAQVAERLGLAGGSSTRTLKGHATRLDLDVSHLGARPGPPKALPEMLPDRHHLRRAGPLLAAAWFELCGLSVSWPLEPRPFDLLVWRGDRAERIQVKTGTLRSGSSYLVWISTAGTQRTSYDPNDVDSFFVIDGDLDYYLIPLRVVGGLSAIQLSAYEAYRLQQL